MEVRSMRTTRTIPPEDRLVGADDAAELLGVSRRWLLRVGVKNDLVPFVRPPGARMYLFDTADLRKTIATWKTHSVKFHGGEPRDAEGKFTKRTTRSSSAKKRRVG
jgi:hypothetical protein